MLLRDRQRRCPGTNCAVYHVGAFRLTKTLPRRGQGFLRGKRKEMEIEAPAPICS